MKKKPDQDLRFHSHFNNLHKIVSKLGKILIKRPMNKTKWVVTEEKSFKIYWSLYFLQSKQYSSKRNFIRERPTSTIQTIFQGPFHKTPFCWIAPKVCFDSEKKPEVDKKMNCQKEV